MSTFDRPEIPSVGIAALLEDEDRRLLSDYGEFRPLQTGQTIIEEGKPQDSLYFVISGVLHVHTLRDGKPALLARIEAGTTLGEINVFDPATASASVTAKSFAQIWRADRQAIEDFVGAYPAAGSRLLIGILAEMSQRIRNMNEKLATAELEASLRGYWQ
jgi:CRP/FNR family cyclic AMP-dependent transcriptional regulator